MQPTNSKWLQRLRLVVIPLLISLFTGAAQGNAMYSGSINATLTVLNSDATGLDLISFVDDDGMGLGTIAFVDPPFSAGSASEASGNVDLSGVASGVFAANATISGNSIGFFPSIVTSAFASAQAGGGFSLINPTPESIEVELLISWAWAMGLLADNSTLEQATTEVSVTLFENGIGIEFLVAALLSTPLDLTGSESLSTTRKFSIAGHSEASYAILIGTTGLAQSIGTVSEPDSILLIIIGMLGIAYRSRPIRR